MVVSLKYVVNANCCTVVPLLSIAYELFFGLKSSGVFHTARAEMKKGKRIRETSTPVVLLIYYRMKGLDVRKDFSEMLLRVPTHEERSQSA